MGRSFVVQKGRRSVPEAGKPATGPPWALADRFSRAGNKVGTLLRNPPPVGGGDLWPRSRGNCCRSDALRGVGRGRGPEHTDLGPEAGRDIKRQGADFLSRSPVLFSPLARLPVPSCCFLIGCRQRTVPIVFSVSKNFDTLLKNASIFSRGCRPLRALAFARTLAAWEVCFPTYTPPENTI